MDQPVEKVYQKKTQIEHILLRPDSYVGSIEANEQAMWILAKGEEKFREKTISFVPGLYKIFGKLVELLEILF
jgi:DNA topoisomerase II